MEKVTESLSDEEQDLLKWKPSDVEIDEDNMRRVLERNWDMWSYPTSYLKDCQWAGYEDKDASQTQNSFDKAKRKVRDTFASISAMVGSQYTYQEAQNFLLTTTSTINRYKDTIADCKLIRGLFEDPSGTTTGVPGYPYNWENDEIRRQKNEADKIWVRHPQIREDIANRVKKGDLKNKIKNDALRAELGITDENANQSMLTGHINFFNRDGKKLVNINNVGFKGWDATGSRSGQEMQFTVPHPEESWRQRIALDTDTEIKNRGGTLYQVCHYDEECGTRQSIMATNNYPGIYMVRLPQSIWDMLRQDRSKNLFCTLNNMMHNWSYQEWEITKGITSVVGTRNATLESYGIMCDNNFIQDERVELFHAFPPLEYSVGAVRVTVDRLRKVYKLNPYYDIVDSGKKTSDPKWDQITLPTYLNIQPWWIMEDSAPGTLEIITTGSRDNWYSLSPIKARFDFFKDDE
jgi:hypothetical protein